MHAAPPSARLWRRPWRGPVALPFCILVSILLNVGSTLHNVRVVEKSHTYIMYSPVAISDARGLAATPYRLFGARRPVARVCHPPGSPPQRWSIHTGAVSRQCSSAGFSHSQELAQHLQLPTGRLLTQRVVLLCADSRP